jgi:hypothetical protein
MTLINIQNMKWVRLFSVMMAFALISTVNISVAQEINDGVPQKLMETLLVVVSGDEKHEFTVQWAKTNMEHTIGLMWVREMADDKGMLFEYKIPGKRSFWMKNTFIPLDLIYIQRNGTIANIAVMAEPFNLNGIPSKGRVLGVFEINGGLAQKLGIKAGDTVHHPMFKNWPPE